MKIYRLLHNVYLHKVCKADSSNHGIPAPGGHTKKLSRTDQFVSSLKGRLPHTFGRENNLERYSGGTIFIDESSKYITLQNQVSLGATETLQGKHRMERDALCHIIFIKSYRCNNGVYRSNQFVDDLLRLNQTIQ